MVYINETREVIRDHIGRLMYSNRYLKGTVETVGVNYITAVKARRFGADHFTGSVIYFIDGPAAGSDTYLSENEAGTGKLTMLPVPLIMPAVGNKFEVWPEDTTVDDVNDAINLAILDVQHLASHIAVLQSPTIDLERKRVTIPATWDKVAYISYEYGGIKYHLRPRHSRDPNPWDQNYGPETFDIEGQGLVVHNGIPDSASNIRLIGYEMPEKMDSDADVATVRSDFIVYKAASILSQDNMAGELLDPQRTQNRAVFWAQQAEQKKRELSGQWIANTVRVEEYL